MNVIYKTGINRTIEVQESYDQSSVAILGREGNIKS